MMRFWHALPEGWELMGYEEFLEIRQKMIAKVIKAGFEHLTAAHHIPTATAVAERRATFAELAEQGESLTVEFKSSMIHSYKPEVPEKVIIGSVIKTIAAFLNSEGGTLVIGADDDAHPLGIDVDLQTKNFTRDSYENFIMTAISNAIDTVAAARCRVRFENLGDATVCLVDVESSSRPVYATTDKGKDVFFVRTGNATRALETKEVVAYIQDRFGVA
jgi:predicted HTH transcriptional regulator